jgi:hypothetical protein
LKRKRPSFSERGHGYRSFSDLLEDAQRLNCIQLRKDERSGSYIITGLGGEKGNGAEIRAPKEEQAKRSAAPARRRRPAAKKAVKKKAETAEGSA